AAGRLPRGCAVRRRLPVGHQLAYDLRRIPWRGHTAIRSANVARSLARLNRSRHTKQAASMQPGRYSMKEFNRDTSLDIIPSQPRLVPAAASVPSAAPLGGMIGALVGMRIPEAEARQRESGYHKGSVLVTAKVYEGVIEAKGILQRHGGNLVEP